MNEVALSDDLNVITAEINKRQPIKNQKELLVDLFGCCEVCAYDYKPSLQVHHVVQVSKGGSNDIENLALLCPNCHGLVHSLMSDSAYKVMSSEDMDLWLNKNFNSIQKDKVFYYALRLLRGEDANV